MKDGLYDFHFSALGVDHPGTLSVYRDLAEGADDHHALKGRLSRVGANLTASFEVARRAPRDDDAAPQAPYTLKMIGTGTATQFNVIGLAPLGLIVELRGTWRPGPDGGPDDRDLDREHVPTAAAG